MTPEETKAQELVEKFYQIFREPARSEHLNKCIQCAIIHCDEVLRIFNGIAKMEYVYFYSKTEDGDPTNGYDEIDFYQKVKQILISKQK